MTKQPQPKPLSTHASGVLGSLIQHGPEPTQNINPGVVDKLLRDGYARIVQRPSPFETHKGANIAHLEAIPEAEREAQGGAQAQAAAEKPRGKAGPKATLKRPSKPARKAASAQGEGEPKVSKGREVLGLLQRKEGATNAEIQDATGWKPHTVRGFFAGAQMARMGHKAVRFQRADGVWAYRAESTAKAEG